MRNFNLIYFVYALTLISFFNILNCFVIPNFNSENENLIPLSKQSVGLIGNLRPNTLLQNAQYIGEKKLKGPESIAFDNDGNMYTGLANGQIVKVDKNDNSNIQVLARIGDETNDSECSILKSFLTFLF